MWVNGKTGDRWKKISPLSGVSVRSLGGVQSGGEHLVAVKKWAVVIASRRVQLVALSIDMIYIYAIVYGLYIYR